MNFGVVQFPGSNCDRDVLHVLKNVLKAPAEFIWHDDAEFKQPFDCIVLPGGFAHGDYLRTGAMAKFARIMPEVLKHAERGGYVLGICNGFQILTELKLLPGALLRNRDLNFHCKDVFLKIEQPATAFTRKYGDKKVIRIPINHGEGCYYCAEDTLKDIEDNGQVVFRYCSEEGVADDAHNPNGSLHNIAGVINAKGNVLGLMPHPERASEEALGNSDGRAMFESLLETLK